MKILNNLLQAEDNSEKIKILISPNVRELIDPDYVVIHYTATDTASSAIDWFMNTADNPDKIAAHVVLDTDGSITQLIPFNHRANHAGTSTWDGVDNFNFHAVGIEIVNAGFVEKLNNGSFRRALGNNNFKTYPATDSTKIIKVEHKHKFWTGNDNHNWFAFPNAQLQALYKICKALFTTYHLINAVGHDDISPARKPDPGPAFPWDIFKTKVFGSTNNSGKIFRVNTEGASLRSSFSISAPAIKKLPAGYEVGLIETNGQWSKVYLVDKTTDVLVKQGKLLRSIKTIGWIFSSLLTLKPV